MVPTPHEDEEALLRSVALQNAKSILLARQRAEEALRAQTEWLRITLASIGDGVISTDAEGRVTFLNAVAETLTGWTQAEALGRSITEVFRIIREDTRQPVENPTLRALREGAIVGLANHTILIARDGTERPVADSAAPIRDASGTPVGAVLVFRNVTEGRQAEVARERLAAIVESSEDAIVSKTLDGIIQTWNGAAARLFGYTPEEAVGRPITLIIPPDLIDEERTILDRVRSGERVEHFETVRIAKDGRLLDISLTVSPVRLPDGRIIGASKIARDITERNRVWKALRESEERYRQAATENAKFRAFFEQGTNFAGVLTLDGTVVEANRLCLDACGFVRDEVIGKPFWECGWWNRSPALMEMVRTACRQAAEGQQFRQESNYFVANGDERFVDLILAPVADAEGRVLFVAATGSDVTERRRMEDALREADRKKDEFIALLGHELRNPLAPIRNGLQVIRLAGSDENAVAQARDIMDRQLGHMVRLIDDLLDVARIGQNKMELRRSRVSLAEVVSSAVETARPAIEEAGHALAVTLPKEPLFLDADLTRLSQVFSNLLTNSAKYTPRGGRIRLDAERRDGALTVSVQDTGIGIPSAFLPNLFDMFSQVDRSNERSTGGLGIGLAIVKGLVEMHGGTVIAESEGPGRGSKFLVRLPLAEAVPEPVAAPSALKDAPPARPARRILVVDDNKDSARSMGRLLKLLGNDVRVAHDGIQGVETAAEFQPDIILMDVGMPRLNGYEATRRIREQPWGGSMTIIALTGWGQEGDRVLSREAGCDGHLVKPVSLADLEALLNVSSGQ